MKKLEKLQCELPTSAVLNRHQSISLKGGGDKRKDRPSNVISVKKVLVAVPNVSINFGIAG